MVDIHRAEYHPEYHLYSVTKQSSRLQCLNINDLVDFYPLPSYMVDGNKVILLKHSVLCWQNNIILVTGGEIIHNCTCLNCKNVKELLEKYKSVFLLRRTESINPYSATLKVEVLMCILILD